MKESEGIEIPADFLIFLKGISYRDTTWYFAKTNPRSWSIAATIEIFITLSTERTGK